MHEVVVAPHAARDIKRLPKAVMARIDRAILKLQDNPYVPSIRFLRDSKLADFRIRVGDYRILFDIDKDKRCIIILRIGHRKEIYR